MNNGVRYELRNDENDNWHLIFTFVHDGKECTHMIHNAHAFLSQLFDSMVSVELLYTYDNKLNKFYDETATD